MPWGRSRAPLVGGAIAVAVLALPGLGTDLPGRRQPDRSGALAGVATGVVGGAVGGGIVGALVGLDFPEHEALLYEQELKAGRALVGVRAGERIDEAWDIIRLNGGRELQHEVVIPPTDRGAARCHRTTAGDDGARNALPCRLRLHKLRSRKRRHVVTAPSDAERTVRAYFASTPRFTRGSGFFHAARRFASSASSSVHASASWRRRRW